MSRLTIASVVASGIDRLLHIMCRTQKTELLATEGDEDHRAGRRRRGESRGDLDQHCRSRRVVVGTVVHLARAVGVEASELAEPQMIVVRADDHRLVAQHRVPARQQADDVAPLCADHVRALRSRRVSRDRKDLKPAACRRLKARLFEPASEIRRRRIGAG